MLHQKNTASLSSHTIVRLFDYNCVGRSTQIVIRIINLNHKFVSNSVLNAFESKVWIETFDDKRFDGYPLNVIH